MATVRSRLKNALTTGVIAIVICGLQRAYDSIVSGIFPGAGYPLNPRSFTIDIAFVVAATLFGVCLSSAEPPSQEPSDKPSIKSLGYFALSTLFLLGLVAIALFSN